MPETTDENSTSLAIVSAALEEIREAGRIPIGSLYAVMRNTRSMPKMDIGSFEGMVRGIVRTGLVREENRVLIWEGD
jgi:hypothetical protein